MAPTAKRLAAIPLKLNPRTNVEVDRRQADGCRPLAEESRLRSFLAIKGGGLVGGLCSRFVDHRIELGAAGVFLIPRPGVLGFRGPDIVLSSRIRSRRDAIRCRST